MRNYREDNILPQRFRMPEKDTRSFYEKPEWWVQFVKWGIVTVLMLGAAGFGASFAIGKWQDRRRRIAAEAQEARLREIEEEKVRAEKAAREKAAREAREKARAEANAERERLRREKMEEQAARNAEAERRRAELESREVGPRGMTDLVKKMQTAGVRWWGTGVPPKFAGRKAGDEYWCIFPEDRDATFVRVKVGDGGEPAAIEIVDATGRMREYGRELLEDAVAKRPHLVMMDRAAWVRVPQDSLDRAAHVSITDRFSFHPMETLLGENLYRLVRSNFRTNARLDRLGSKVEFHWRGETRKPLSWTIGYDDSLSSGKLYRAVEEAMQAELDAANAVQDKTAAAAKQPEKKKTSGLGGPALSGSASRSGRRLGENYGSLTGPSSGRRMQEQSAAGAKEAPRRERVADNDVRRVIDEGYLSASFAE